MSFIATIFKEAFGLLVDDVGFAASIVVWIVAIRFVRASTGEWGWGGLVLFAGLVLILIVSVAHRASAPSRTSE